MAKRRSFSRKGSFRGRTYGASASRRGVSANYGKIGFNLTPAFLLGSVVGFTNLDDKIPAEITLACSSLPITGIGPVKAAAQGILCGNLVQSLVKNKGLSGKGSNFGV
jgi:hypothetical protein